MPVAALPSTLVNTEGFDMQKSVVCAVPAIVVLAFATPRLQGAEDRPTIAIVSFEAAQGGWTLPPPQLGETIAQLLLDRLVTAGVFRVMDGEWLQYGVPEAGSRRLEVLRTNAQGAGVDYLVFGAITGFSNERRNRTVGGAGFKLPLVGGLRREKNELAVAILTRVVDVRTGEVLVTTSGEGSGVRRRVGVAALGLVGAPVDALVSGGSSRARDAQLDEAVQAAVQSAADALVGVAPRLGEQRREALEGAVSRPCGTLQDCGSDYDSVSGLRPAARARTPSIAVSH